MILPLEPALSLTSPSTYFQAKKIPELALHSLLLLTVTHGTSENPVLPTDETYPESQPISRYLSSPASPIILPESITVASSAVSLPPFLLFSQFLSSNSGQGSPIPIPCTIFHCSHLLRLPFQVRHLVSFCPRKSDPTFPQGCRLGSICKSCTVGPKGILSFTPAQWLKGDRSQGRPQFWTPWLTIRDLSGRPSALISDSEVVGRRRTHLSRPRP